ncbi:MAG: pantetheine-phosphate adenylyltransferase [Candidatus Nanoarchaeia archaeon]|jgi:pantetheine-phosphate adenylyltransferase
MNAAIFPLTGDPMHYGHMEILRGASRVSDKVYLALGINPEKEGKHLFTEEERIELARNAVEYLGLKNIEVETFSGWLADYAKQKNVNILVRGARNEKDLKYETMAAEYHAKHGIETILIPTYGNISMISSTKLKDEVRQGKLMHEYTTPKIKQALEEKLLGVTIIGVTGQMGSGKSTYCRNLADYAKTQNAEITHIDADNIAHFVYSSGAYPELQKKIAEEFGADVIEGASINRKALARKALATNESRLKLMQMLAEPFREEVEKIMAKSKGIVLLDAAYLDMMLPWVNYNAIMVTCNEEERMKRVIARDKMSEDKYRAVSSYLLSPEQFRQKWKEESTKAKNGKFYEAESEKMNYREAFEWIQKNFPRY